MFEAPLVVTAAESAAAFEAPFPVLRGPRMTSLLLSYARRSNLRQ